MYRCSSAFACGDNGSDKIVRATDRKHTLAWKHGRPVAGVDPLMRELTLRLEAALELTYKGLKAAGGTWAQVEVGADTDVTVAQADRGPLI
jgi:hypothetical protein